MLDQNSAQEPLLQEEPKWQFGRAKKVLAAMLILGLCAVATVQINAHTADNELQVGHRSLDTTGANNELPVGASTQPTLWNEEFEKKHLLYRPVAGDVNTQVQAMNNHINRVSGIDGFGNQAPNTNTMIDLASQDVAKDAFIASVQRMKSAYATAANRVPCHPPGGQANCIVGAHKFRAFNTQFNLGPGVAAPTTKLLKAAFQNAGAPYAEGYWTIGGLPGGYNLVKQEDGEPMYLRLGFQDGVVNHFGGLEANPGGWSRTSTK